MKRLIIIILVLLAVGIMVAGCGTPKGEVSTAKTLVVGMELAYPPFETKDEQGNPSGVSVDLAKALGEYLGDRYKSRTSTGMASFHHSKPEKLTLYYHQ